MNSSKIGFLVLLSALIVTAIGVVGYACSIKLQGDVSGGISVSGNTVTFSIDVTSVLDGPSLCTYSGLPVEADLDIINHTINFGGHKVEIYGEYEEWSEAHTLGCGIYIDQPGHYIRVIDDEFPPQIKLDIETSPPDGARKAPPITFRARVASNGQPVRDATVDFVVSTAPWNGWSILNIKCANRF